MSLLHGFDIHLKLFQLKVHLGMRKISLCEFSFLIPILQALCHLEVPTMVRIKKAYALWIKIMGKFNPTPQHQLPTIHFTWIEMFTGRENWRVRIIFLTTIAVNNPRVEPFHFANIQPFWLRETAISYGSAHPVCLFVYMMPYFPNKIKIFQLTRQLFHLECWNNFCFWISTLLFTGHSDLLFPCLQ